MNSGYLDLEEDLRRAKRTMIEKRANPPLIPVPMENPLREATMIRRSFSESSSFVSDKEDRNQEDLIESEPLQCVHVRSNDSPPEIPSISPPIHEQREPFAFRRDGDMTSGLILNQRPRKEWEKTRKLVWEWRRQQYRFRATKDYPLVMGWRTRVSCFLFLFLFLFSLIDCSVSVTVY